VYLTNCISAARKALEEVEIAQRETLSDLKATEQRLAEIEQRLGQAQSKLDDDSRDFSEFEILRRRLQEEIEDERDQFQKDLAERDFTLDQMRKKYQGELAQSIDGDSQECLFRYRQLILRSRAPISS
jgi:myosin protein heavy chain